MAVVNSFGINLVEAVGPESIPLLLKSARYIDDRISVCVQSSPCLWGFSVFPLSLALFWGVQDQILELRSPFVLHFNKNLKLNFVYTFGTMDYLKNTVNVILFYGPLWCVKNSIVNYVLCLDTFFTICIHGTSVCNARDPLRWQQTIDLQNWENKGKILVLSCLLSSFLVC